MNGWGYESEKVTTLLAIKSYLSRLVPETYLVEKEDSTVVVITLFFFFYLIFFAS